MSPGINDPATAVLSIHALTDLFRYHLHHHKTGLLKDTNEEARISRPVYSFGELFEMCIYPILSYGGKDQYIQNELLWMIAQLKMGDEQKLYQNIFDDFANEVNNRKVKPISNTQVIKYLQLLSTHIFLSHYDCKTKSLSFVIAGTGLLK